MHDAVIIPFPEPGAWVQVLLTRPGDEDGGTEVALAWVTIEGGVVAGSEISLSDGLGDWTVDYVFEGVLNHDMDGGRFSMDKQDSTVN